MPRLPALVAALAGFAAAGAASSCNVTTGQDFQGGDVNMTVCTGVTDADKDASCCAECRANPSCSFWVRAHGGPGGPGDPETVSCWLKDGFQTLVPNAARRGGFVAWAPPPPAQLNFSVKLGAVTHHVTTRHMGCHLDSGFGQELLGLHSNIVFSPSFEYGDPTEEPDPEKNPEGLGWVLCATSKAQGALEMTSDALHGKSALGVKYYGGSGALGVANRGIGNEGIYLSGGKPYEGYLFAAADVNSGRGAGGGILHVELQNYETGAVLASQQLTVPAGSNWTRYNLSLTPTAGTDCVGIAPGSDPLITCDWQPGTDKDAAAHVCVKCAGQLFVGLTQPGAVAVDFVYVEPGGWGRFKGLPVLKPMAEALQTMGVKLFRAGGTVADSMFWKDWRGPMWKRKPLVWRSNEVSGFGPFETIDFCAAAGILPVMTTAAADHTAEDMGDLIEYAFGDETTEWGKLRHEDQHPEPYNVTWFELGNEQQNPFFAEQVAAMEERAAKVGVPPNTLHYLYPWGGGGAGIGGPRIKPGDTQNVSAVHAINALGLGSRIAVDDHVFATGGLPAAEEVFADPLLGVAGGWSAIILETNCGDHTFQRALTEAQDLMAFFSYADKPDRMLGRAASFCMERAGYNSGGWNDQGLIFFLPNMTWFQPPAYVHAMISDKWRPNALAVEGSGKATPCGNPSAPHGYHGHPAGPCVSVAAQAAADGKSISVQLLNMQSVETNISLEFLRGDSLAVAVGLSAVNVTWLQSDDTNAVNTPAWPEAIKPYSTNVDAGKPLTMPRFSFGVFELALR